MRLLLVSSEFPPGPGGIGSHAYQVVHRLWKMGWEVTVLSPQEYVGPKEIKTFNESQPFEVVRLGSSVLPPLTALRRFSVLYAWVKNWQPHVVLASGERPVWLTALLARLYPIRWATIGHGLEFGNTRAWCRLVSRWAFSSADGVICVSNYTRGRMLEMGVTPRSQVVIPNGADESFFQPLTQEQVSAFRRQLGLEQNPLLLTVGHVTERKGQDVVIRALPRVLQSAPEAHYLMAGLPALQEPLTELARSLGVEDRIHFLGRVDADTLAAAYNACDVYIMTSRHSKSGDFEGYGIAVVEAAFCGKPSIVSAGSGLEEAISAGKTGLVVPEDDPRATADAIIELFENPDLRQQFGRQARERALGEQTWASRKVQYDRVLKAIANGLVPSVEN